MVIYQYNIHANIIHNISTILHLICYEDHWRSEERMFWFENENLLHGRKTSRCFFWRYRGNYKTGLS